jgi:hypothetical protein
MRATSSNLDSDFRPPAPSAVAISRPGLGATLLEYFLRFVIVALGIGVGCIAAVIIGFLAGWIQINC